jgi:hypothetical protein
MSGQGYIYEDPQAKQALAIRLALKKRKLETDQDYLRNDTDTVTYDLKDHAAYYQENVAFQGPQNLAHTSRAARLAHQMTGIDNLRTEPVRVPIIGYLKESDHAKRSAKYDKSSYQEFVKGYVERMKYMERPQLDLQTVSFSHDYRHV